MFVWTLFIQALALFKKELAVLCPSERCPDMPAVPNTLVYRQNRDGSLLRSAIGNVGRVAKALVGRMGVLLIYC